MYVLSVVDVEWILGSSLRIDRRRRGMDSGSDCIRIQAAFISVVCVVHSGKWVNI
ncbi:MULTISPECIES: hypothetical protein [Bartonella]|uniref:Uncharacterized protein n=1 Tax=Bartonella chomelii TaxID=236402 RepID=A0ABR6E3J2_9HYPH|nr:MULTISPECIES: hypothetical protein [Bartonella]MBA9082989.1 hypothetical protein [Bartonella chomelii]